ncbi:hypothetical protein ACIQPT_00240 [Streptomyces sp. NPDC091289]|uniref:hypothetical protein n=1 Tax=Streptomyces sp. NPDC091289 TaxID=3365989 RepID=UPI003809B731
MPRPIRMSRRRWMAAWAVLCAAGLAGTAGLKASSTPGPRPAKPVSAECRAYIAYIETQLAEAEAEAEAEQKGEGDVLLAFSRVRGGTDEDCRDELRDRFRRNR